MSEHLVCELCGGTMAQNTTSLHLWHDEQLVIVRDVPASVCQQCGQSHVAQEISAQIEKYLHNCDQCQPQRYIQVPEFSADQILATD